MLLLRWRWLLLLGQRTWLLGLGLGRVRLLLLLGLRRWWWWLPLRLRRWWWLMLLRLRRGLLLRLRCGRILLLWQLLTLRLLLPMNVQERLLLTFESLILLSDQHGEPLNFCVSRPQEVLVCVASFLRRRDGRPGGVG